MNTKTPASAREEGASAASSYAGEAGMIIMMMPDRIVLLDMEKGGVPAAQSLKIHTVDSLSQIIFQCSDREPDGIGIAGGRILLQEVQLVMCRSCKGCSGHAFQVARCIVDRFRGFVASAALSQCLLYGVTCFVDTVIYKSAGGIRSGRRQFPQDVQSVFNEPEIGCCDSTQGKKVEEIQKTRVGAGGSSQVSSSPTPLGRG
ncbi:MAG: hypothetical protein WCS85_04095 [Candidatus Peribacteraceae bacterium]